MNQSLTQRLYEYQYQFDAAGNRTQMKYFDGSTTTTTSYTHNNGNCLKMDEDDRLTEVVRDEYNSSSYVYDALGRRLIRTSGTTSTFYYYDGLTVIAEKQKVGAGAWDWQRIFTVAPGVIGNIFRISEKISGNWSVTYYHYDAIGNVVLRTNGYGGVLESLDQDAYGNVKIGSQSGYHLTTKEYDSIPELYYFNARWYDAPIGIFISKSPLSVRAEHPFNLCENNPISYMDFNGLASNKFKEEMKRAVDLVKESCGLQNYNGQFVSGKRMNDQESINSCCSAMGELGKLVWRSRSFWGSLFTGGPLIANAKCADQCACKNHPQDNGKSLTGTDLIYDFAECMYGHADVALFGGALGIPGLTPKLIPQPPKPTPIHPRK